MLLIKLKDILTWLEKGGSLLIQLRLLNSSSIIITTISQESMSVKWNHGVTKTLSDTIFLVCKVQAGENDAQLFVKNWWLKVFYHKHAGLYPLSSLKVQESFHGSLDETAVQIFKEKLRGTYCFHWSRTKELLRAWLKSSCFLLLTRKPSKWIS